MSTASPPPDVFGSIDGEALPIGKLQEMRKFVEPLTGNIGKYVQPKSWVDFAKIELAVPKKENAMPFLSRNLAEYKGNYIVMMVIFLLITIITSPFCLLVVVLMAGGWAKFLQKQEDESWEVSVGGISLDKQKRLYSMAAFTALMVIVFLGDAIGSVLFCSGFFILGHGVMHKPLTDEIPEEENII